ncbi:aspartic proteinase 36-like [Cornus florida]|uniref:aspartic proteinase 36-like n=1 Tax=Cornus florida TaxID=4283 RepID=UPI002899158A|nr:aspartic proteinase 36-like [Cornus florida]
MMDLKIGRLGVLIVFVLQLGLASIFVSANIVFNVQHKFARRESSLGALKAHDAHRHRRILSAVDLPLGGNGHPTDTALYFSKIGIGTPSKDYYVQVDTGSDILWVNCVGCDKCPTKSDIGIKLRLYDPKGSSTGNMVTCDEDFCNTAFEAPISGCKVGTLCQYSVTYGDGSSTAGYFVKDRVLLDKVTGNLQTMSMNGTVAFGCGARQSGELGSSSEALDGILGFGQANSSMISQLAAAGKVKKMFAHCLDGNKGGGIFAIGEVVQPKLNSTPLVPNQAHYNVIMKAIEVGGDVLDLPTDVFDTESGKGTIIDSGTTLAYLPREVFDPLMRKVLVPELNLKLHTVEEQFTCFQYAGNVDDGFPDVTFHFENSLSLTVYPHEYLFQIQRDVWCVGWQNSGMQSKDGKELTLLGDFVLSNKLVLYDLEKQSIGWAKYNCSSSIQVKDEETGAVYLVGAHNLSSACFLNAGRTTLVLLLLAILLNFIH